MYNNKMAPAMNNVVPIGIFPSQSDFCNPFRIDNP